MMGIAFTSMQCLFELTQLPDPEMRILYAYIVTFGNNDSSVALF